jgi:hypothetical protein
LLDKQKAISAKSLEVVTELGESTSIPRRMRGPIRELGREQGEIAERAEYIAKALAEEGTLVFTYVLESVAMDANELRSLMGSRRPRLDRYVLGIQEEIATRLQSLLDALRREMQRKKEEQRQQEQQEQNQEEQQENTNEGDRQRRLVPDMAELKMLRSLEVEVRDRIEGFLRLRERLGEDLGSTDEATLNRLSLRHARISELFREFLSARGMGAGGNAEQGGPPEGAKPAGEGSEEGGNAPKEEGK